MDLGTGSPLDESVCRAVVAVRLARTIGCSEDEVRTVLYASLLEHLGCTAASPEAAATFGDDISLVRASQVADTTRAGDLLRTFVPAVSAGSGRSCASTLVAVARHARSTAYPEATCEVARGAAVRLGLGDRVAECLAHVTAAWNGSGYSPAAGAGLPLGTRIMHAAGVAALVALQAGSAAAVVEVRRRSGREIDPDLTDLLEPDLFDGLLDPADGTDPQALLLDLEPDPVQMVDAARLTEVAHTFGDVVDLKSIWLHGHSGAVAGLAADAARSLGIPDPERIRIAGHLHDIGRIAVSSRIWSKPGALTASERDQARLHPYFTDRILARVASLDDVRTLAAQHHERCDGSGYHRGLRGPELSLGARVLAAADRYRCDVEDRPHRAGLHPDQAADRLTAAARAGRLDGDAVHAVLAAAGHRGAARRTGTAGLTDRQVEVLRLMVRGLSNHQIATRLVISPRTAEHHVQDIYARIGVRTRAGAAVYAMEHGLLERTG